MAQNISLWNATYSDVPAVTLPTQGGGNARFTDTSPTTAVDSDVASGKVYFKSDGTQSTGTATGGVDIPVFTASWNQNYELISVSCSETFAQCYARYINNDGSAYYHGIFDVDGDSWDGYYSLTVRSANSNEIVYTYFYGAYPAQDIVYRSNGQINFVDQSSASLTLNVSSNGDYYPSDGVYTEVHVSVPSGSPTLQTKTKTYTPSTTQQTESVSADSGYDGLDTVSVTVNAMPTGTAGTPTATKGTVSNHSVSVTPSVTNTTGYITGSTKTGTAVTVTASELASGNKSITENGTDIDVIGYSTVSVNVSGGTSVQTKTGTFTGSNGVSVDISCDFAPDLIYVYGDLSGSTSNRGVISITIVKDTMILQTSDTSSSSANENASFIATSNVSGYVSNSSYCHATYSNSTLTIATGSNTSSNRFTSGITYSYKLLKWTT